METEDIVFDDSDNEGEFSFETDLLAVRGNKDYSELIKYIVKLEAQKENALRDMEDLSALESKALNDPLEFVKELTSGNINFPARQTISNIPKIEWERYGIEKSSNIEKDTKLNLNFSDSHIRESMYNDNKLETFNQKWSFEEQKKLEQLLEIYPEEAIEKRRYEKIAQALGTRTPIQVSCRVQKYFAKLSNAGLPIPGLLPKNVKKSKLMKQSTFFPQLNVPVQMEDFNDTSDTQKCVSTEIKSDKAIIDLLRSAKEQRLLDETSPVYQTRTMCVGCQKSGYLGARWTDNAGTDYCTDCVVKLLPTEKLIPIRHLT